MCYLVRQHKAEAEHGNATQPPGFDRLRPRWAAAVAATLIGGFAVAALVVPSSAPPVSTADERSAPAPIVSLRTESVPAAAGVEQTSMPADDGVPGDVVKAGLGHCHHSL